MYLPVCLWNLFRSKLCSSRVKNGWHNKIFYLLAFDLLETTLDATDSLPSPTLYITATTFKWPLWSDLSGSEFVKLKWHLLFALDIPLILETPFVDEGKVQMREIQLLTDMAELKMH